jgi:hypothetical protein
MEEILQINRKHQLRSISNGAVVLSGFLVAPIYLWLRGQLDLLLDFDFYLIMFGVYLLFFLPAFYIHIVYYLANRKTVVEVDKKKQLITVTDKKGTHAIHASDIKQVVRVIQRDYRLPKWQQNWYPVPWRKYGYLKLITHDNRVFLLTSLMLNPINTPVKETETQYKFLPDLDEAIEEELTQAEIENQLREEVESFKQRFKNYSEQELLEKILKKGYRKEAVMAAEELLKENYTCQQELKHT